MTRRIESVDEVAKLNFVNEDDKWEVVGAMIRLSANSLKPPVAKIYETRNIKQLRLYVYDSYSWKYNLFLYCDLAR